MAHHKRQVDDIHGQCESRIRGLLGLLPQQNDAPNDLLQQLRENLENWQMALKLWRQGSRIRFYKLPVHDKSLVPSLAKQLLGVADQLDKIEDTLRRPGDAQHSLIEAASHTIQEHLRIFNGLEFAITGGQDLTGPERRLLHERIFDEASQQLEAVPEQRRMWCFADIRSPNEPTFKFDETLSWFWKEVWKVTDQKYCYTNFDIQDGYIADENGVRNTGIVLEAICNAFLMAATEQYKVERLEIFVEMARIAIILNSIEDGKHYFHNFLDLGINDKALGLSRNILHSCIVGRPQATISRQQFYQLQFRLKPRLWQDRNSDTNDPERHVRLLCDVLEPLPVEVQHTFSESGTFCQVQKVFDPRNSQHYALKRCTSSEGKRHVLDEIEILRKVGAHRHIIELKRWYERGEREAGFLALPVADCSLSRQLEHFVHESTDRKSLTQNLLEAFGCLSVGLRFLHTIDGNEEYIIRHLDIKPENLLWAQGRMIIADFGLGKALSAKEGSRLYKPSSGTRGFVAPEATPANRKITSRGHGRATDIFALGCVFLEMLSAMIYYVHDSGKQSSFKHIKDYSGHMDQVKSWINNAMRNDKGERYPYKNLLKLSSKMISPEEDRPKIEGVIQELRNIQQQATYSHTHSLDIHFFCTECRNEMENWVIVEEPSSLHRIQRCPTESHKSLSSSLKKIFCRSATKLKLRKGD